MFRNYSLVLNISCYFICCQSILYCVLLFTFRWIVMVLIIGYRPYAKAYRPIKDSTCILDRTLISGLASISTFMVVLVSLFISKRSYQIQQILPKVIWEEPHHHPLRQRMDSPTTCAGCALHNMQCPLQMNPVTHSAAVHYMHTTQTDTKMALA